MPLLQYHGENHGLFHYPVSFLQGHIEEVLAEASFQENARALANRFVCILLSGKKEKYVTQCVPPFILAARKCRPTLEIPLELSVVRTMEL